jgi:hypothetical protein
MVNKVQSGMKPSQKSVGARRQEGLSSAVVGSGRRQCDEDDHVGLATRRDASKSAPCFFPSSSIYHDLRLWVLPVRAL